MTDDPAETPAERAVTEMADAVNLLTDDIDSLIDIRDTLVGAIERAQAHLPEDQRVCAGQWDEMIARNAGNEQLLAKAALSLSVAYQEGFVGRPTDPDPGQVLRHILVTLKVAKKDSLRRLRDIAAGGDGL